MKKYLFEQIDNSSLIVFRWLLGLLLMLEGWGAIALGWVKRVHVDSQFTFNFIGFDFLQALHGEFMYVFFAILGLVGFAIMIGLKYRWSMAIYFMMWMVAYLIQKESYNNHYFLMVLVCGLMLFFPANTWASWDAKKNPEIRKNYMPRWVWLVVVLQLLIVYTYASVAKLYPDWLDSTVATNMMANRKNYPIIGDFLQTNFVIHAVTWYGILFDLLIIPMLLWRKTRVWALGLGIFFHLFNSAFFQIGVFPYMSLAFFVFFFSKERINTLFFRGKKPLYTEKNNIIVPKYAPVFIGLFAVYFIIQIGMPLRHWFFQDHVLWTEEGHRMSWRMMLRSRAGHAQFYVINKETQKRTLINLDDYVTP
ncbi:MAG: HTTM domain-containing protein, partial [Flavobacteriaceae bacterium]|nr:HTTM domain-containing protein [Flavobacteriaceae bacterium]